MLPSAVRSVFASDLHMGNKWSHYRELHHFLKEIEEPEHLYLVGDIIDGWSFRRGWHWSQENNNFVRKVLSLAKHGCHVHYLVGNHDDFLLHYVGQEFGQLRLSRETVHTTADGRRFLVMHGDQFDLIAKAAPILYMLGDVGYAILLRLNLVINAVRRMLRRPHWSFSMWAKQRTKQMVNFLVDYENLITRYAAERNCDGVITGHTHTPVIKQVGDVLYVNCGDFQEQATAVVEHFDGRLELIDLCAASLERAEETAVPASPAA
ncbi:MAG: UDP-2,3-diacylglucosamine diphosphatase [Planctomycetota bacterium]